MNKNDKSLSAKTNKTPWPTKQAMEQVYDLNLWGTNNTAFYSGEGSHNTSIVKPYLNVITHFLKSFKTPLVVCDLGCGDFNIGKQLVSLTQFYYAIDIVSPLIAYNKTVFKAENLQFDCLDISKDEWPKADCVLIRQVLQHLSNAEVSQVVSKLHNYKYVVLTEHLPQGNFTPNNDIISGQGIRLKKNSGIDLLVTPFNLKVKSQQELLRLDLGSNKGVIVTALYEI